MSRQNLLVGAASAAFLSAITPALAQSNSTTDLETVTVTAQRLEQARAGIQTQLGASTYTITAQDIENLPGGDNTPLNSVILQMPGVAQDSFGQLHIRGEHNAPAIPHQRHHPARRHLRYSARRWIPGWRNRSS